LRFGPAPRPRRGRTRVLGDFPGPEPLAVSSGILCETLSVARCREDGRAHAEPRALEQAQVSTGRTSRGGRNAKANDLSWVRLGTASHPLDAQLLSRLGRSSSTVLVPGVAVRRIASDGLTMLGLLEKAGRRAAASLSARNLSIRATGSQRIAHSERKADRCDGERREESRPANEGLVSTKHHASPLRARHVCAVQSVPSYLLLPRTPLSPLGASRARVLTPASSLLRPLDCHQCRCTGTRMYGLTENSNGQHMSSPPCTTRSGSASSVSPRRLAPHSLNPDSTIIRTADRPTPYKGLTRTIVHAGPVMVVTVPEIRKRFFGYKPVERPPTSYPRECS
jgi:hypothetical protein